MTTRPTGADAVWAALGTDRDPELDETITDLRFVTSSAVEDGVATIRLRLPTYFCAPNFAYLMVADAHDAVRAVPGVESVDIRLDDHFASAEINSGIAAHAGLTGSFPGETEGDDLAELRSTFQRKAHTASLDRVCRRLLTSGYSVDELTGLRLADVPESAERAGLLRRRDDIGLPTGRDEPLVVNDCGERIDAEQVTPFLRFAKTVRISIEANSTWCRGLLDTRYGERASA